jgi:adenylate cyclase
MYHKKDKIIMDEILLGGHGKQNKYWHRLAIKSSLQDTPLNELIRRSAFMYFATINSFVAAPILLCICLYLNKLSTALNPAIFISIMFCCLTFGSKEGRYYKIVYVHQVLILIMPIHLQFELGGLIKGGFVCSGSMLCPLGAAFFCPVDTANIWLGMYFIALLIMFLIERQQSLSEFSPVNISLREQLLFFMNIFGVTAITFCGAMTFRVRLDTEYRRSEKLLDNVLPKSIAKRLKAGESDIIDNFDSVSILFADLVGFTVASAEMHPAFLIGIFLRDVFSAWDKLCENRSMEKIKTIGDAFMAVGGLDMKTDGKGDETAVQMVLLGLEMQQALDIINERYDMKFKCRIGIHSGPVIAGVIGVRKFAFDVWGDAVNTASRMESHGMPGYLQMSSETHDKVKGEESGLSHLEIKCRGEIEVKGKGKMKTFLIEMKQNDASLPNKVKKQSLVIVKGDIDYNCILGGSVNK